MSTSTPSLDISRLERVRHSCHGKVIARCPACAEEDRDRSGIHLAIFPEGRFTCAAHPGDRSHRRRIFALAGITSERPINSDEQREWIARRDREQRDDRRRATLVNSARANRRGIIERHPWNPADVWHDSPQRIDCNLVAIGPHHFLSSLFPASTLLWTGHVHESGKPVHSSRWKLCSDWLETSDPIGPMTTPAAWKPDSLSRSADNVLAAPFTVLDFDGFDGMKPATPAELNRHILDSLALIRWLRKSMDWQLAAILWTGGKSLHAWFHTPPPLVLDSLSTVASALGMDAGLIGRPEHPCRLPGQAHAATRRLSRVLWLETPI